MLGFESLVSGRFTFGGYWAPRAGELNQDQPHRALLAGALTLLDWNADVTAILIKDAHSGAGLSAARTLGDATLVYADLTARRGRDRMRIRADRSPGATPGAFVASAVFHNLADHSGVFGLRLEYRLSPKLLLGLHGRYFYGKANDEYALRTARRSAALYVTARI